MFEFVEHNSERDDFYIVEDLENSLDAIDQSSMGLGNSCGNSGGCGGNCGGNSGGKRS